MLMYVFFNMIISFSEKNETFLVSISSFSRAFFMWFTRPLCFLVLSIKIIADFIKPWNLIIALYIGSISADITE